VKQADASRRFHIKADSEEAALAQVPQIGDVWCSAHARGPLGSASYIADMKVYDHSALTYGGDEWEITVYYERLK